MQHDAVLSSFLPNFRFNNVFNISHFREGRLINQFDVHNSVVTVGKNDLLDVAFGAGTQKTMWYFGLINNSPTPTLLTADSLASHTGWTEWSSYSGNRKEWVDAAAADGAKGTSSLASFTMTAAGTLYGAFLTSVDTGTSGILWAHTAFPDPVPVVSSDIIKLNYTISILTE